MAQAERDKETAADVEIDVYDIDGPGKGRPRVTPGHARARRGESLVWHNLTEDDVEIRLPRALGGDRPIHVAPGKTSAPFEIEGNQGKGGYTYHVLRITRAGFMELAVGGSDPVIIIR